MNCSSGPGAASGAHSRNVAQWQSSELITYVTGSNPVVPIWSMCVNGPEGCGTQLNSRQAGTVLIVMTEITRNLSGIRDSPERRALYGALMEDLQKVKPKNPFSRQMQMKVRFLLLRFCGSYPQNRHFKREEKINAATKCTDV